MEHLLYKNTIPSTHIDTLPDGTVQIETTGVGTGLELDIRATNLGTELLITVSSPGRGQRDGDLLTIPQAVLSPVFGNAIVRDLEKNGAIK